MEELSQRDYDVLNLALCVAFQVRQFAPAEFDRLWLLTRKAGSQPDLLPVYYPMPDEAPVGRSGRLISREVLAVPEGEGQHAALADAYARVATDLSNKIGAVTADGRKYDVRVGAFSTTFQRDACKYGLVRACVSQAAMVFVRLESAEIGDWVIPEEWPAPGERPGAPAKRVAQVGGYLHGVAAVFEWGGMGWRRIE